MSSYETLAYQVARRDFLTFLRLVLPIVVPGIKLSNADYIRVISVYLSAVTDGDIKRLIINLPPRYLKSLMVSVLYVAWRLGRDPALKVIVATYNVELTTKHANDFRLLIKSGVYRKIFPETVIAKDTETEVVTTLQGGRFATSIGGTLTGRGCDLFIIDDPIKADEAMSQAGLDYADTWFRQTAITRLNSKRDSALILIMQRLHADDMSGRLLQTGEYGYLKLMAIAEAAEELELPDGTKFVRKAGEALDHEREPIGVLNSIRASMGSHAFEAQYQQMPTPAEGNMIKAAWLKTHKQLPYRDSTRMVIQSWDTAVKTGDENDFSVCVTFIVDRNFRYCVVDVFRAKLAYPDLKRAVGTQAEKFKPTVILIEDTGNGSALAQELKDGARHNIIAIKPEGDKKSRVYRQTAALEAGRLSLPEDAPWLSSFLAEILGFPNMKHDDQVDALIQGLAYAEQKRIDHASIPNFMPVSITGESRWKQSS